MHVKKYLPRKIFVRDYSNYDVNRFKADLRNTPWENCLHKNNINSAWDGFKTLLHNVIDIHAPLIEKKIRGKDNPWLTSSIKQKINTRDYHLRKARRTNSEIDWSAYKRHRNDVTYCIRSSKANYYRNLLRENISNPKDFWKQIKKSYPVKEKGKSGNSFNINDEIITDKKSISNAFCKFFANVGSSLVRKVNFLTNPTWKYYNNHNLSSKVNLKNKIFKFNFVQVKDVLQILKRIKPSKASGVDTIPGSMIKDGAEELAAPISFLANQSFQSGLFPTSEKCAKITPTYKSGCHSDLDNYRPISVLNIISKVLERIAYQQISEYLENNNLLCKYQYGFRQERSTQHAVKKFVDYIRLNIDRSNCTGALYMDFRKAFDTVNHSCILQKLPCYGIKDQELMWLGDYLFNRSQFVCFDGETSDREKITHGVPQGSILGPLLFIILVNDIHLTLEKCQILMYADDTVLYYADKDASSIENILNTEAALVNNWINENTLFLNLKKTKTEFVLYGSHQKLAKQQKCSILLGGMKVNEADQYEYLGITLDKHLNLTLQVNKLYKRITSRINLLSRIRHAISPTAAESIYSTMINPLLLYCYPIYAGLSCSNKSRLQSLQDRAKVIVSTERSKIWLPVETQRKQRMAIDVFKSVHKIGLEENHELFNLVCHQKNTRSNGSLIRLPTVKTEAGRKSCNYQAGIAFNELVPSLRNEKSFVVFKRKVKCFDFGSK